MEPLARFIIGNGETVGYTFAHPRLVTFFGSARYLGKPEAERVHASFLAWGREALQACQQDEARPAPIADYLLNYYAEHLVRSGADSNVLDRLICRGWMKGWEHIDPTHRGFLGVVRTAWEAAKRASTGSLTAPFDRTIAHQMRCLLCFCSVKGQLEIPAPMVIRAALETGALTERQALSILASRTGRFDFEEHARSWAPFAAPSIGAQMASLASLRAPSLEKVRALISIARHVDDDELAHLVVDKAARAAKQCRSEVDGLFAAIALIRFAQEDRRHALAIQRTEDLRRLDRDWIPEEVILDLASYAPSEVAEWVQRAVQQFLEFAAFVDNPSAPAIFDLLSADERTSIAATVVARPIQKSVDDRGCLLAAVAPSVALQNWTHVGSELSQLPLQQRLVVLASLASRPFPVALADLYASTLRDLDLHLDEAGGMEFVRWADLLERAEPDTQTRVTRAIVGYAPRAESSDYWLRRLPDVLRFLPPAEKRAASLKALTEGMLHHDERATLELLGDALAHLSAAAQTDLRPRLAQRIQGHLGRSADVRDPIKLGDLAPLLRFVDAKEAARISTRVLEGRIAQRSRIIGSIISLFPYFSKRDRSLAKSHLDAWVDTVDSAYADSRVLSDARPFIDPAKFEWTAQRLFHSAAAEPDPEQKAQDLAHVLLLLSGAPKENLAKELKNFVVSGDWDERRLGAARSLVRVAEPEWNWFDPVDMAQSVMRADRRSAFQLLIDIVAIARGTKAAEALGSAMSIRPVGRWEASDLAKVLHKFERGRWPVLLHQLFESVLQEARGRPHGILRAIFPVLAEIGGPQSGLEIWNSIWAVTEWWP
jgi:hypothetical protein